VKWNSAFIFPAINISGFPFNEPTSELIYVDRCRLLFAINYANENAGKFICHLRLIVAPAGGTCCGSIRLRIGYAGEIEGYPIEDYMACPIWAIHRFPNFSDGGPPIFVPVLFHFACYLPRHATHFVSFLFCFPHPFPFPFPFQFSPAEERRPEPRTPNSNGNPSPSAVVVINGRVLLIELPTNSVFMRLRRVHFAGLGIAVGWVSFGSRCFLVWLGFAGFGWVWLGLGTPEEASKLRCYPRQEIVFNLPLRLLAAR